MTFDAIRPHKKDRTKLIEDLIHITERLQTQNERLLTQLEKVGTVALRCRECSKKIGSLITEKDTILRRQADATKELGSGNLG
jgi:hypothetical protein